jgi:hypothetical protein
VLTECTYVEETGAKIHTQIRNSYPGVKFDERNEPVVHFSDITSNNQILPYLENNNRLPIPSFEPCDERSMDLVYKVGNRGGQRPFLPAPLAPRG